MKRAIPLIAATTVSLLILAPGLASSETLQVAVRDENNNGVASEVVLYKTPNLDPVNKLILGETNQSGVYTDDHTCDASQVILAHPNSKGEYFDSTALRCKQKLLITVIHRRTPMGLAFNGIVTDIVFPDGSKGVIATWAYLNTTNQERKIRHSFPNFSGNGASCLTVVKPQLENKIYKIVNNSLQPIASGKVAPSKLLNTDAPDTYSAIFPSSCADARPRIAELQNNSASRIDQALKLGILLPAATQKLLTK